MSIIFLSTDLISNYDQKLTIRNQKLYKNVKHMREKTVSFHSHTKVWSTEGVQWRRVKGYLGVAPKLTVMDGMQNTGAVVMNIVNLIVKQLGARIAYFPSSTRELSTSNVQKLIMLV